MKNSMMKTYNRPEIVFTHGKGPYLYDSQGTEYLDFVAGVAVNALGHAHPALVATLTEQASKMMHCSNLYYNDQQLKLSDRLTLASGMNSVFFANSGAEAIETALKVARKFGNSQSPDKNTILYLNNSFHGRTMGGLSVTGQEKYQKPFKPLIGGTKCLAEISIECLEESFDENVCALILETIQGEGGIIPLDEAFLIHARKLCDQYNALLVFDEVQCGLGRTGELFSWLGSPVKPDVMSLAKGLGGGFPIGATLVNERADCLVPGDHGCTFGGNPLACAVANTVLDHLTAEGFLSEVTAKGNKAIAVIQETLGNVPHYKSIEGKGLILGIHLNGVPASKVVAKALEEKILLVSAGPQVVRLVPPLNISEDIWIDGIKRVCEIIKSQSE